jgi:hypothetical protein
VWESDGGRAVLRFSSIRVREGGRRWRAVRRRDGRAAMTSVAEARRRPGDGPDWVEVDHTGRAVTGRARKKMSWASNAIGPNWQCTAKNSLHNFQTKI